MSSELSIRELQNHLAVLHEAAREVGRSAWRSQLVTTLTETYDLRDVAAAACARSGVAGYEEQVAYCLVVLCQKDDPSRKRDAGGAPERAYQLDVGDEGFAAHLERWADTVARNLGAWATRYEAIHEEAARFEITTLRTLIRARPADDDVVDVVADKLANVLLEGTPLRDMTLARARDVSPSRGEYVFQSPLGNWVNVVARRSGPRSTDPTDAALLERAAEQEDPHEEESSEIYRSLVSHVLALAETRDSLPEVIEFAEGLERKASEITLRRPEDKALIDGLRAQLLYVADELRREQRALGPMLEYIALAMYGAPKLQLVAMLSLRTGAVDPRVGEVIAQRMRAIAEGGSPPTPALITKVGQGSRDLVPRRRLRELERLRDDLGYRVAALRRTGEVLDGLPATARDLSDIGTAVPGGMSAVAVSSTRHRVSVELDAVDPAFGRVFRRFAFGAARQPSALKRYVAQLPGDQDAVTSAMAERAIDQATREEALLSALKHRDAAVRARAIGRVLSQRILDITPPIAAQLAVIAGTDTDPAARAEGVKALEKLGLPVPVRPSQRRDRSRSHVREG